MSNTEFPRELACPICLDLLYKPVKTQCCGHVYCFECINNHMKKTPCSCPYCNQLLTTFPEIMSQIEQRISKEFPNLAKKRKVDFFKQVYAQAKEDFEEMEELSEVFTGALESVGFQRDRSNEMPTLNPVVKKINFILVGAAFFAFFLTIILLSF